MKVNDQMDIDTLSPKEDVVLPLFTETKQVFSIEKGKFTRLDDNNESELQFSSKNQPAHKLSLSTGPSFTCFKKSGFMIHNPSIDAESEKVIHEKDNGLKLGNTHSCPLSIFNDFAPKPKLSWYDSNAWNGLCSDEREVLKQNLTLISNRVKVNRLPNENDENSIKTKGQVTSLNTHLYQQSIRKRSLASNLTSTSNSPFQGLLALHELKKKNAKVNNRTSKKMKKLWKTHLTIIQSLSDLSEKKANSGIIK